VSYFTLRWWRNVAVERPPPMIMRAVTGSSDNRIRFQSAMCPGRMYLACTWPLSDLAVTDCNDDGIAEWCFLVRRQVGVICATGEASASAAKAATTTIPIVFLVGADPVNLGLVTSIARPDGNVTGINFVSGELAAKRLELLRELVPRAVRLAVLVNPNSPLTGTTLKDLEAAAHAMGLQIQVLRASTSREIEAAFAGFARERRCSSAAMARASHMYSRR
jgi:hypothetical protein